MRKPHTAKTKTGVCVSSERLDGVGTLEDTKKTDNYIIRRVQKADSMRESERSQVQHDFRASHPHSTSEVQHIRNLSISHRMFKTSQHTNIRNLNSEQTTQILTEGTAVAGAFAESAGALAGAAAGCSKITMTNVRNDLYHQRAGASHESEILALKNDRAFQHSKERTTVLPPNQQGNQKSSKYRCVWSEDECMRTFKCSWGLRVTSCCEGGHMVLHF